MNGSICSYKSTKITFKMMQNSFVVLIKFSCFDKILNFIFFANKIFNLDLILFETKNFRK